VLGAIAALSTAVIELTQLPSADVPKTKIVGFHAAASRTQEKEAQQRKVRLDRMAENGRMRRGRTGWVA
jgi:hypothetical protein